MASSAQHRKINTNPPRDAPSAGAGKLSSCYCSWSRSRKFHLESNLPGLLKKEFILMLSEIILEPYPHRSSHHWDSSARFSELFGRSEEVVLLCNNAFEGLNRQGSSRVVLLPILPTCPPNLRSFVKEQANKSGQHSPLRETKKTSILSKFFALSKFGPVWIGEEVVFAYRAAKCLGKLRSSVRQTLRVFIPTADQPGAFCFAFLLIIANLGRGKVEISARLVNSNPRFVHRWLTIYFFLLRRISCISMANEIPANLRLLAQQRYLAKGDITSVPYPPKPSNLSPSYVSGNRDTLVVSILGRPSLSKGSFDLPDLLPKVYAGTRELEFRIQGGDSVAHWKSSSETGYRVTNLPSELPRTQFLSEIQKSDFLLLPYRSSIYFATGSAMFFEAADLEVPVIARAGCGFASLVEDEGLGFSFNSREALEAILATDDLKLQCQIFRKRLSAYNVRRLETVQVWFEGSKREM